MGMLPIETNRLRLRRFEPGDALAFAQYRNDPSVARYQSWSRMTLVEACDFIAEQAHLLIGRHDQWFQLAIEEKVTSQLVGDIGICVRSPGVEAEIGFSIAPSVQGRGYAAEACRAAITFAFSLSAVATVEAVIDGRNIPAIAVARRLGMTLNRTEEARFKGEICLEHHFVCSG